MHFHRIGIAIANADHRANDSAHVQHSDSTHSVTANLDNDSRGLVRGLSLWAAMAAVIGNVIGSGVFLVSSEMARDLGSGSLVIAVWTVGGILSLIGALCFAELGAAIPKAGGIYLYLSRGLGPVWGFLFGWMSSFIDKPASMATLAAGFLRFVGFLAPAVAAPLFILHIPMPFQKQSYQFAFTLAQPLAAAVIILVTAVNYLSVRFGGRIQLLLTSLKVTALLVLIALGFASRKGPMHFEPFLAPLAPGVVGAFLAALVPAMWAYKGFEDLGAAGEEVENPSKNFLRALIFGMLLVTTLYVLANCVYFRMLPFGEVARSSHIGSDVFELLIGRGGAKWFTVAMMISALGALHIVVLAGGRIPFAMVRDGLFFNFAKTLHATFHTPTAALFFQGTVAVVLALSGTYEELFALVVFASWIFLSLSAVALLRLRKTEPALPRPYSTWGYPWTPCVFIAVGLTMTVNLWLNRPIRSSIGLAVILLGLPFYFHWRKKSRATVSVSTHKSE